MDTPTRSTDEMQKQLLNAAHRLVAGALMVGTVAGVVSLYQGYSSWSQHMRALRASLAAAPAQAAAEGSAPGGAAAAAGGGAKLA